MSGMVDYHEMLKAKFNLQQATSRLEQSFSQFLGECGTMEHGDFFWTMLNDLTAEIARNLKYRRSVAVSLGCDELIRKNLVGTRYNENEGKDRDYWIGYSQEMFKTMCRFHNSYVALVNNLYKMVETLPNLDRGDDSFNDLCDALPLAGQDVIAAITSRAVYDNETLVRAVHASCKKTGMDPEKILHGENYVRMTLFDKLLEFMSIPASNTYGPRD